MLKQRKIILNFILLSFFSTSLYAKCYYVPCNPNISLAKSSTQSSINAKFEEVMRELELLKQNYENHLSLLKNNNEKLNIQIALMKKRLLKNKELLFLMKKFNNIENNHISQEALQ